MVHFHEKGGSADPILRDWVICLGEGLKWAWF